MDPQESYKRVYVKEARPCFPEKTGRDLRPVFQRLAEDAEFRSLQTFRSQVWFAKVFVEDEADLEKDLPIAELMRFFDVPHDQTIRAILNAKDVQAKFMGRKSKLSDNDFEEIKRWIAEATVNKKPLTLGDIVARLRETNRITTKDALRKAFKRRKQFKVIEASPVNASRLRIDDEKVQQFHATAEALLHDVPAAFVFNMDETYINEYANAKKKKVVVDMNFPGETTEYPVEQNTNSSTLVACIAADGTGIPPLLVVKHRTIREVIEEMCWTEEKVTFTHSQTGFITSDIFMRWLREVFIPNVNERRERIGNMGQRAYLLMDNCQSHKSDDITLLCGENNVELVYFPPNATHIYQPLDLCFFGAFKKKVLSIVESGIQDNQSERVLKILDSWDSVKKVSTIRSSFRMGGFVYRRTANGVLVSFSREAVRNLEGNEDPAPQPSGGRIPIANR